MGSWVGESAADAHCHRVRCMKAAFAVMSLQCLFARLVEGLFELSLSSSCMFCITSELPEAKFSRKAGIAHCICSLVVHVPETELDGFASTPWCS